MTVMTRFGFEVSTVAPRAATAFEEALTCTFSASDGTEDRMREALEADPSFALPAFALGVLRREQWECSAARDYVTPWERDHIDLCLQQPRLSLSAWAKKAVAHIRLHPSDAWMFDKLHLATFFSGGASVRGTVVGLAAELARAFPFDLYRQVRHGFALAEGGEPQRALLVLDRVLEQWPTHLAARHSRVHALHGLGRHAEAAEVAGDSATEAGKFRAHFGWHQALVALADGEVDRALENYRPSLASRHDRPMMVALADAAGFAWAHAVASGSKLDWPEFDALLAESSELANDPFAGLQRAALACLASPGQESVLPEGPFRQLATAIRNEDWAAAVTVVEDLDGHRLDDIGGSRLQRAVLPLMFTYCLERAGRGDELLSQLHSRFSTVRAHPVLGPKLAGTVGFRRRVTTPIGAETRLRICVVDSDSASRMRMLQALGGIAANVSAYRELSDLDGERVAHPKKELLLVNHDSLSSEQRAQLKGRLKDSSSRCVVCAVETGGAELAELCEVGGVANIVASSPTIDATELRVTIEKLLDGRVFGIDKYFAAGVATQRLTLHKSEDRGPLLDSIENFARDCVRDKRRANLFTALADELVTNAIYNAPVFTSGERRFSHFPRTRPVTLAREEGLEITWLCDGATLGLSVADPFGSLDLQQIRSYMATYFRTDQRPARRDTAGAGLGLYQAFAAVNKFVCNVQPGERTEMIGLMSTRGTFRDFRSLAKSFHVFVGGDRMHGESGANEPPRPENCLVQGA